MSFFRVVFLVIESGLHSMTKGLRGGGGKFIKLLIAVGMCRGKHVGEREQGRQLLWEVGDDF